MVLCGSHLPPAMAAGSRPLSLISGCMSQRWLVMVHLLRADIERKSVTRDIRYVCLRVASPLRQRDSHVGRLVSYRNPRQQSLLIFLGVSMCGSSTCAPSRRHRHAHAHVLIPAGAAPRVGTGERSCEPGQSPQKQSTLAALPRTNRVGGL